MTYQTLTQTSEYVLGDDCITKDNLYYGIKGEQVINSATRKAFPEWTVKHNSFGSRYEYACGHGVDLTATKDGFLPIYGEVKNLKQQPKPYGTDFVKRHVLPRFEGLFGVKVLFITFLSLLTQDALVMLKRNGIIPFEIGERLTTEFFKHYEKVYQLANRIKSKVQPKPSSSSIPLTNPNTLTPYCISSNTPISNNKENNNKTNNTIRYNEDKAILEELKTVVQPIYVMWLRYKADMEED
jgi:hypothetical protein